MPQYIPNKRDSIYDPVLIQRNGKIKYRVRVNRDSRTVHTKQFNTKKEARIYKEKLLEQRYGNPYGGPKKDSSKLLMKDIVPLYIENIPPTARPRKENTHTGEWFLPVNAATRIKREFTWLHRAMCGTTHDLDACMLTLDDALEFSKLDWLTYIQKLKYAHRYKQQSINQVNAIMNWLRDAEYHNLKDHFTFNWKRTDLGLQSVGKPKYTLTVEEAESILACMEERQYPLRFLYQFSLETGLRPNELLGLTYDKIFIEKDISYVLIDQRIDKVDPKDGGPYYQILPGTKTYDPAVHKTIEDDPGYRNVPLTKKASVALTQHKFLEDELMNQYAERIHNDKQNFMRSHKFAQESWTDIERLVFKRLPVLKRQGSLQSARLSDNVIANRNLMRPLTDSLVTDDLKYFAAQVGISIPNAEVFGIRNSRNYLVTKALRKMSAQKVRKIVGHRHESTTELYNQDQSTPVSTMREFVSSIEELDAVR
jgi:integrase